MPGRRKVPAGGLYRREYVALVNIMEQEEAHTLPEDFKAPDRPPVRTGAVTVHRGTAQGPIRLGTVMNLTGHESLEDSELEDFHGEAAVFRPVTEPPRTKPKTTSSDGQLSSGDSAVGHFNKQEPSRVNEPHANIPAQLRSAWLGEHGGPSIFTSMEGSEMFNEFLQRLSIFEAENGRGRPHQSCFTLVSGLSTAVIAWLEVNTGLSGKQVCDALDTASFMTDMPSVIKNYHGEVSVNKAVQVAAASIGYPAQCGQCAFMARSCATASGESQAQHCRSGAACPFRNTDAYIRKSSAAKRPQSVV